MKARAGAAFTGLVLLACVYLLFWLGSLDPAGPERLGPF